MRPPYPPDIFAGRGSGRGPGDAPGPRRPVPGRMTAGQFGLSLFLASLTMLFGAALLAYLMVRTGRGSGVPAGRLALPPALWASTGVLLVSGVTAEWMRRVAPAGSARALGRTLAVTFVLGAVFLAVQVPALIDLLAAHGRALGGQVGIYGLAFTLVILHAAHVVGGLAPLGMLAARVRRSGLTVRRRRVAAGCAIYWHFLDGIWVVMFATFLLTR